jgi:hypothetical protein
MRGIAFCKMAETQSESRIEITLHTFKFSVHLLSSFIKNN